MYDLRTDKDSKGIRDFLTREIKKANPRPETIVKMCFDVFDAGVRVGREQISNLIKGKGV